MEHRVADRRILRLIQKWLKAGVSEDGQWSESNVGTPQGAVVSPLLANVYLHYVFDLWIDSWRKKVAVGEMIVVRYADDLVVGFESRAEAERFLSEFRERLAKFGLELHADKTRLIEFGQFAERNRKQRGGGEAGNLYVPRLHALLREAKERWHIHRLAQNGQEADGGETASVKSRTRPPEARPVSASG